MKILAVVVELILSSFIRRKGKKCRLALGEILVSERFKIKKIKKYKES